jgi:sigma-E factor negative regulatory protein RseA
MTDTIKEQLSAFLDGELPEAETTLLLKRLDRDDDLKGTLSRYSLIGAALRADGEVTAARHVASRVRAAIAIEPALPTTPARDFAARWLRPVAGLGIAAGVAAATLLVMPQLNPCSGIPRRPSSRGRWRRP